MVLVLLTIAAKAIWRLGKVLDRKPISAGGFIQLVAIHLNAVVVMRLLQVDVALGKMKIVQEIHLMEFYVVSLFLCENFKLYSYHVILQMTKLYMQVYITKFNNSSNHDLCSKSDHF